MGKLKTAMLALALAASALGAAKAETRSLVVAGGCFWCVESDFDHMEGVVATTSGYARRRDEKSDLPQPRKAPRSGEGRL